MHLSARLDWISATFPYTERMSNIGILDIEGEGVTAAAHNGYTEGERFPSGALRWWNPDVPRMGVHVIYSGATIDNLTLLNEISQADLLHFLSDGGRISRLDLAITAAGFKAPFQKLHRHVKAGQAATRAKQSWFTESAESGKEIGAATCYVGSLTNRKKLLRVYDKGQQIGATIDITRFELETRGKVAQNAAKRLKTANFEDYGAIMRGMIRHFCQWPEIRRVHEIFASDEPIPIQVGVHERGNTAKWLLETVAPVLARSVVLEPILMSEFMIAVSAELRRLGAME